MSRQPTFPRHLPFHAALATAIASLTLLAPAAAPALSPGVDLVPGASAEGRAEQDNRILTAGGETLRQAPASVSGLRTIDVPEAALQLHLWEETGATGRTASYYAISQDGSQRGRARETSYAVELADFSFDPLTDSEPALADGLLAGPQNRLHLVQLWATPLPELQAQITGLGAAIHRHYTQFTMMVEMDDATKDVGRGPALRPLGRRLPPRLPDRGLSP